MSLRRGSIAAAVAVLVTVVLGWTVVRGQSASDADWVAARVDDLIIGVEIDGTLQSRDSSQLGPPPVPDFWDYKISFMAPEGEEVGEGTPVLGFDISELERRLLERQTESSEAAKKIEQMTTDQARQRAADELKLAEARAKFRKAGLIADVPEELEKGQVLAEALLDRKLAETEIAFLEKRLESTERSGKAALDVLLSKKARADQQVVEIEDGIERMTVRAQRDGKVIYISDWRGEKKKIGDSCWRGEYVIELPDLNAMIAQGKVDEADAGRIREGLPTRIRLDAHPDIVYSGRVESIWRTVQRKSWRNPIKVVRLDLGLDETDTLRMRPGMRFQGTVEIERVDDALVVPLSVVFLTSEGPVVYRRTLLGHERVSVRLGRRNDEFVQVLEGLEPGDHVAEQDLERQDRADA